MKTQTTLVSADTKSGTGARGAWLLTIFKAADGQEYSTFDGNLASRANALLNQPVEVEFEARQNGQYTNYTLKGIEKTYSGEVAVLAGDPVLGTTYDGQLPKEAHTLPATNKNDQFRTKEQIMRTDALQAALQFSGIIGLPAADEVGEFEGWFNTFYKLIEEGVFETPDVRAEAAA